MTSYKVGWRFIVCLIYMMYIPGIIHHIYYSGGAVNTPVLILHGQHMTLVVHFYRMSGTPNSPSSFSRSTFFIMRNATMAMMLLLSPFFSKFNHTWWGSSICVIFYLYQRKGCHKTSLVTWTFLKRYYFETHTDMPLCASYMTVCFDLWLYVTMDSSGPTRILYFFILLNCKSAHGTFSDMINLKITGNDHWLLKMDENSLENRNSKIQLLQITQVALIHSCYLSSPISNDRSSV